MEKIKAVSDAGPLIHLGELDCLDLLADFASVLVPKAVWEEVRRHRPSSLEIGDIPLQKVSTPRPSPYLETIALVLALDPGEVEALSLMSLHPKAFFLTDDAAARLAAKWMGYRVHGTIGILIRSIRCGRREPEEVVEILRDLPRRSSLYISRRLLKEIIGKLEREFGL